MRSAGAAHSVQTASHAAAAELLSVAATSASRSLFESRWLLAAAFPCVNHTHVASFKAVTRTSVPVPRGHSQPSWCPTKALSALNLAGVEKSQATVKIT